MTSSVPPEGWLLKAHDGEILVDLIYRPAGGPIGDEHFERATPMELMAQPVLVASIDDVLLDRADGADRAGAGLPGSARDRALAA